MKSILVACLMIMFTLSVAAQSIPSVPKLPTEGNSPVAVPSAPTPRSSGNSPIAAPSVPTLPTAGTPSMAAPTVTPPSGTLIPGAGQTSNPIDRAKTEAECKIPINATKPECVEQMLKK